MDIAFDWTLRALVTVLAGSVFVVVLAVLYPALRANRLKLSDVMRYE
jgi:ABC-type lipoprotein release transport system permease subunit